MYSVPRAIQAESVIFEQFGTLVGSTSYLHVHIPLYISKMLEQHDKYLDYVESKFSSPEKIRNWLFAGAFEAFNITSENVRKGTITQDQANALHLLNIHSKMYYEISQLHLRDLEDIKSNIWSLHNLMPDLKAIPGYRPERDSAGDQEGQLPLDPDHLFVAQQFAESSGCYKGRCPKTSIPDTVVLDGSDFDDRLPIPAIPMTNTTTPAPTWTPRTTTRRTTTRPTTTTERLNVANPSKNIAHYPSGKRDLWDQPYHLLRKKRFAGLVALPIAIAATAMGLYNRKQLESLREELFNVKSNTKRLFSITQDLTLGLQQVEVAMNTIRTTLILIVASNPTMIDARMTRIENQLRHRIQAATHAIQAALQGRFSIDYLDPKSVGRLFRDVQKHAKDLQCELLIEHHVDLFQVETSLLFDGKDGHLILHLPMAPKEGQLRLFRLHPFPLPLFDDQYLIPDVKNDVIAISSTDERLNIQMAAAELLSCHRMGQLFLCDNFGVLSRRFNQTCLGALYFSLFSEAEKLCRFRVVPAEEQVYQVHKGEFVVYSPNPTTVNIRCRNGTASEKHLRKGTQRFTLSKGCSADLDLHKVIADYSTDLGNSITVYDWDWDSVAFMDGKDKELQAALEHLQHVKIHAPELSELQYVASMAESSSSGSTGRFLTAVSIIALAIGLIAGGVGCYCWCQRFSCCRPKKAEQRRGRRKSRKRKRRSAGCGLLCCCRQEAKEDHVVEFRRRPVSDREEFSDDEIARIARYPGTRQSDSFVLARDLRQAEDRVANRLDSLHRQDRYETSVRAKK